MTNQQAAHLEGGGSRTPRFITSASNIETQTSIMTEEQTENLVSSLESGHGGIEAFLSLPGDDRAMIVRMLEQRAGAEEIRQIVEQCEADGTMDKIRAFLTEHHTRKNREQE
jgi:hypothetical protein